MPPAVNPTVFAQRLRNARVAAGLSQRNLGIVAGLDPFVASARINRYERGTHEPPSNMAAKLAQALGVPMAYLYSEDERLAEVVALFSNASKRKQGEVLKLLRG
jgi:transcriptional regulator with XRE-family HTH domain